MSDPFDELKVLAGEGRRIVYIPNDGNHGDGLIAAATVQNFEKKAIRHSILANRFAHNKENVYVYGGGGNFVPMYRTCANVLAALSEVHADVVILPQSCFGVEREILDFKGSLKIWARERNSLNYLAGISRPRFTVDIADDVALSLDLSDQRFYYFTTSRLVRAGLPKSEAAVLHAFRSDCESRTGGMVPPGGNFDLSAAYPGSASMPFGPVKLDVERLFLQCSWFLAYIDYFDIVRTDRLHVGIAAALLNKEVELHDNTYGKNSGVYAYSLHRHPRVKFVPA